MRDEFESKIFMDAFDFLKRNLWSYETIEEGNGEYQICRSADTIFSVKPYPEGWELKDKEESRFFRNLTELTEFLNQGEGAQWQ